MCDLLCSTNCGCEGAESARRETHNPLVIKYGVKLFCVDGPGEDDDEFIALDLCTSAMCWAESFMITSAMRLDAAPV